MARCLVWDVITMAFTCVVVAFNLHLLMMCNTITRWHHISVGGSILPWFIFIFIYSGVVLPKAQENIYFVIYVMMRTFCFYLTLVLVPVAALFCDFVCQGLLEVETFLHPGSAVVLSIRLPIIQEIHKHDSENSKIGLLAVGNTDITPDEAGCCSESQHEVDNKNTAQELIVFLFCTESVSLCMYACTGPFNIASVPFCGMNCIISYDTGMILFV